MHSYQENFFCIQYFMFQSSLRLFNWHFNLPQLFYVVGYVSFYSAHAKKKQIWYAIYALLINNICSDSRESNKKIATANIQPYFVNLVRNYSFTFVAVSLSSKCDAKKSKISLQFVKLLAFKT